MTAIAEAIRKLQSGLPTPPIELVHLSHSLWPLASATSRSHSLHISVLDSSFNPPTLAHLALANHQRSQGQDYDAKLLLLSIRNADKHLKSSDATYEQRIQMMIEFAKDISTQSAGSPGNVAVAIVDEPTFVGKSTTLQTFLRQRLDHFHTSPVPTPKLTFLLGFDTLERVFAPRYYGSSLTQMHAALSLFFSQCDVVCARRAAASYPSGSGDAPSSPEEALQSQLNHFFTEKGVSPDRVTMLDIGERLSSLSSTRIRELIQRREDSWREMVAPNVARYIDEQRLYAD